MAIDLGGTRASHERERGNLIYAAHQPDLLPYSGFFYKMATADIFDLKIWDQFVDRGYQRRVKMRDTWVSLPLVKSSTTDPIITKQVKPEAASFLVDQIRTRYTNSGVKHPKFWDERHEQILDQISSIKTDRLWILNLQLILMIREVLGITTPISMSQPVPSHVRGGAGIVATMRHFGAPATPMTYLSGTGARAYMGDCADFIAAGIPVMWSNHRAISGDSILTTIFDHEDPLSVVLLENETAA
jgi:hypothetical protein